MTSARSAMPLVTAWIDSLRDAFGREAIDAQIRAATRDGLPTFYASENGRTVGVPLPAPRVAFTLDQIVIEHPPEKKPHAPRR